VCRGSGMPVRPACVAAQGACVCRGSVHRGAAWSQQGACVCRGSWMPVRPACVAAQGACVCRGSVHRGAAWSQQGASVCRGSARASRTVLTGGCAAWIGVEIDQPVEAFGVGSSGSSGGDLEDFGCEQMRGCMRERDIRCVPATVRLHHGLLWQVSERHCAVIT